MSARPPEEAETLCAAGGVMTRHRLTADGTAVCVLCRSEQSAEWVDGEHRSVDGEAEGGRTRNGKSLTEENPTSGVPPLDSPSLGAPISGPPISGPPTCDPPIFGHGVIDPGEDLRERDVDPELAAAVSRRLGLGPLGQAHLWRVAGHELLVRFEANATTDRWEVRVEGGWPPGALGGGDQEPVRRSLALHEAFAIEVAGKLGVFRGLLGFEWKLRLLHELGFAQPRRFRFPELPHRAPQSARTVWRVACELWAMRNGGPGEVVPIALSASFLVDWSGGALTESTAISGRRFLERRRFLHRHGTTPSGRPRPTTLYHVVDPRTGELPQPVGDPEEGPE